MSWLERAKSKVVSLRRAWNDSRQTISMRTILDAFSKSYNAELGEDLSEVTYFTCLKTLSESVGKMPVYLIDENKKRVSNHETTSLLRASPNLIQTPAQMFTFLEYCRNHYGNAYAYLNRNINRRLASIVPLDPRRVQIRVDWNKNFFSRTYHYFYTDDSGASFNFKPEEILHFKSWIIKDNGLEGKSIHEILATTFSGLKASSKFLSDLHQHGLVANAVVKFTGDLKRESQDLLLNEIEKQARDNNRRMITLPMGFDIQRLDLTLADSQFYELKKYSALQIAAAFGIQPMYLNDLEKSSYANAAMQNLNFYTSTLLYILSGYEQEMNRKLLTPQELSAGLGFKFNVATILRGDVSQQADVIQKLINCGVYSVNEARRLLDREPCENGEVHFVNGSFVKLQDIGKAYQSKGGDNVADDKK